MEELWHRTGQDATRGRTSCRSDRPHIHSVDNSLAPTPASPGWMRFSATTTAEAPGTRRPGPYNPRHPPTRPASISKGILHPFPGGVLARLARLGLFPIERKKWSSCFPPSSPSARRQGRRMLEVRAPPALRRLPRQHPRQTRRPRQPGPSRHAGHGYGDCRRIEKVDGSWPLRRCVR